MKYFLDWAPMHRTKDNKPDCDLIEQMLRAWLRSNDHHFVVNKIIELLGQMSTIQKVNDENTNE